MLARFRKIDRRRRKRMAVNSLAVCFAPASGTSSNLGRCRFFTFAARTMALRAAPGLSKRRTDQPLSLNPIAISSAVGSDFRSRQTFTMTRPAAVRRLEKCRILHVRGNILAGKSVHNEHIIAPPVFLHECQSIAHVTCDVSRQTKIALCESD